MLRRHGRVILRMGVVLVLLGLATGIAIPFFPVPRLGLSAHVSGVLGGLALLVVGLVWPQLRMGERVSRLGAFLAAYAFLVAWLMPLLAAMWGAGGRTLPFAGGAARGTALQEAVIRVGLLTSAVAVIALFLLLLWGLRNGATE
jgi:hydroxylaminobenzene mutase